MRPTLRYRSTLLSHPLHNDTAPTSLSPDPATPGVWQGSHLTINCPQVTGMNLQGFEPRPLAFQTDAPTTPPPRRFQGAEPGDGGFGCLLFVGCLTSQQHASVSQGRICSDNFTCCHTEIEVADQTFHLTQSQCTDTGPTSPSTDPITPGAWQGSHWSANF